MVREILLTSSPYAPNLPFRCERISQPGPRRWTPSVIFPRRLLRGNRFASVFPVAALIWSRRSSLAFSNRT
jgi:hypothetical protein